MKYAVGIKHNEIDYAEQGLAAAYSLVQEGHICDHCTALITDTSYNSEEHTIGITLAGLLSCVDINLSCACTDFDFSSIAPENCLAL